MDKLIYFRNSAFTLLAVLLFASCSHSPHVEDRKMPDQFYRNQGKPLMHAKLGTVWVESFSKKVYERTRMYDRGGAAGLVYPGRAKFFFNESFNTFLQTPGLFDNNSENIINISAKLLYYADISKYGWNGENQKATIKYEFRTKNGFLILGEEVTSMGSDRTLAGTTRIDKAGKKTFSNNVAQLAKIVEDKLVKAWDSAIQKQDEKRRQIRYIEAKLVKQNKYYKVISSKAVVREMPQTYANEVKSLNQMELIHVTGFLPSGWHQVGREGKPTGWIRSKYINEDITPPNIIITSHDISRGINILHKLNIANIRGRAVDKNGVSKIIVNNKEATVDKKGNFSADIDLDIGKNQIVVKAMDKFENKATKTFTISREDSSYQQKEKISKHPKGRYYALIIGNNNYKYMRKLETAKQDSQDVMDILKYKFGFITHLLLDAKRSDIVSSINYYRKKLKEDDFFLLYYAGHGEFDKAANKAYWLPVDARRDDDTNWIIVDTITSNIRRIASNHILVVADSCYSGTFTRSSVTDLGSGQNRYNYLQKMKRKSSRTLLASGGNEPVSDLGGKGHSVFAEAFMSGLKDMEQIEFTAEELFYKYIKERVAGNSEQTPEYNIIRNSGHDGGDFVFKRLY